MPRCRFVQPDQVRIPLADVHRRALAALDGKATPEERTKAQAKLDASIADGDFIDVKRELNAGEQRDVFAAMVQTGTSFGEKFKINPHQVGKTKVIAYLLGWSFVDMDGKPVPVSPDAIDSLELDTYNEIVEAIDAHEAAIEQAREEKKRIRSTVNGSSVTSPLPVDLAGTIAG